MNYIRERAIRILITVCLIITLSMTLCIQAFAWTAGSDDLDAKTHKLTVSSDTPNLVIQSGEGNGVSKYLVKSIYVPNNVSRIESGAFSKLTMAEEAVIDNYEGGIVIEEGAFASDTKITYLREPPVQVAKSPAQPTTTAAPVVEPTTTQPPTKTTTKKSTKTTTTTQAETTTSEETTIAVTDATPFADAKEQLADVNIWDKMINQTTEKAQSPIQKENTAEKVASYSAVVLVAASAIVLGYFKFKK